MLPTDWTYEALRSLVERYGCFCKYQLNDNISIILGATWVKASYGIENADDVNLSTIDVHRTHVLAGSFFALKNKSTKTRSGTGVY